MKSAKYLFAIILVSIAALPYAQKRSRDVIHFRELMNAREFEANGLHKLSPTELRHLEEWMNDFGDEIAKTVVPKAAAKALSDCVIETKIDDDFEGWDGDTIFKLANGQIWQQTSYDYTYHYAYRPEVVIYKSGSTYKMRVEGVDDAITVRRLK